MDAGLVLQLTEHVAPLDAEDGLLDASEARLTGIHQLRPPAPTLSEARVHPQELAREESGLLAPGAGPDLDHGAALLIRVLGQQGDPHLLPQCGHLALDPSDLLRCRLGHLRVAQKLPSPRQFIVEGREAIARTHEGRQFSVALGNGSVPLHVSNQLGVAQSLGQLFILGLHLSKLLTHSTAPLSGRDHLTWTAMVLEGARYSPPRDSSATTSFMAVSDTSICSSSGSLVVIRCRSAPGAITMRITDVLR